MYAKLKYTILVLFLTGFIAYLCLIYCPTMNEFGAFDFEFNFCLVLGIIVVVFFFLPRNLKVRNKFVVLLAMLASIFLLIIEADLYSKQLKIEREYTVIDEYQKIPCEKMNRRFLSDLNNGDLKYFNYGIFYPVNMLRNSKRNNIEDFYLGCEIYGNRGCYNSLVERYLDSIKTKTRLRE